jgi:hypothetical protein
LEELLESGQNAETKVFWLSVRSRRSETCFPPRKTRTGVIYDEMPFVPGDYDSVTDGIYGNAGA